MVRSLRANGICERFNKAILQELSQVSSGRSSMSKWKGAWQDPDERLMYYNERRAHRGKTCCDRIPPGHDGRWGNKSGRKNS